MRAVLMAILGFIVGAVGAVFLLFFGYIVFTLVTGFEDFEGATSMGIATFIAPVVALAGGVAGAALLVRATRPRTQT